MTEAPATSLEVRYSSRRAVLFASKTEGGSLTLFVPTQQRIAPGERVRLAISLGDADERFELEGTAMTWTQASGRDGVGGFIATFQGDPKRRASEMIAFCAQRPRSMGTASRERLLLRKNCQLKLGNAQLAGEVRDLSQTGAFVVGRQFARVKAGEAVWLKVVGGLFGLGGTWLEAKVIWQGMKGEEQGVGLRFTGNEAKQAAAIQRLLEDASR